MRKYVWITYPLWLFVTLSAVSLETAEDYLNFEWTVIDSNVVNNYATSGDPLDGYTSTYPCDWVNDIGETITGMPYHYGGKDSFDQWNSDYENGGKGPGAHRVHYNGIPRNSLSWAAGIDCSGFVGRCWELAEASMDSCGCTYLRTHFSQITYQQVQPGDAFVSSGHARLCYARTEEDSTNQEVTVIEAMSDGVNKVEKNRYEIDIMQQQNYSCYSYSAPTNIGAGSVSGTWTLDNGPYMINGDIVVDSTSTLTIEPGVNVIFTGHYSLTVRGELFARGTEDMNIFFTAQDATSGWGGLRIINTPPAGMSNSHLLNCRIEYGRATGDFPDNCGGGVFCQNSNVMIDSCVIIHNSAVDGGGVYLYDNSNAWINYSLFTHNTGLEGGGGIMMYSSCYSAMSNNTIVNNEVEDTSMGGGGGIYGDTSCIASIWNSIIWSNTSNQVWFQGANQDIQYCDVEDFLFSGTGNIQSDPLFIGVNPGYYELDDNSPCIDAGFTGVNDPDGTRLDMGAFPFFHTPEPPDVRVYIQNNQVNIACTGSQRNTYIVYSSSSPNGPFTVDETGSFTGSVWTAPITTDRRFYHVTTDAGSRSIPQGIVPMNEQIEDYRRIAPVRE